MRSTARARDRIAPPARPPARPPAATTSAATPRGEPRHERGEGAAPFGDHLPGERRTLLGGLEHHGRGCTEASFIVALRWRSDGWAKPCLDTQVWGVLGKPRDGPLLARQASTA
uniref:hypothetical protein n=1 Tax=Streptomyces sp. TG1A-60 TaxID=3129111 RepID=UPI0040401A67